MHKLLHYTLLSSFLLFSACSKSDESQKKHNAKGEFIFRPSSSICFTPLPQLPQKPPTYSWRTEFSGKFPRITKEFFRCKGNPLNPVIVKKNEKTKDVIYFRDCGGCDRHGLPLKEGKEFIYPCLLEILNYLQDKTGKKVVITTGHRCRDHNTYADPSPANFGSKHMMGAEVDFYIEGMEPTAIVSLIQQYYKESSPFTGKKEFETFQRYDKESNVVTKPWFNKEIFLKLYLENEGRDIDNQHPHRYFSIQLRYDRQEDKKLTYDDVQARNYLRY